MKCIFLSVLFFLICSLSIQSNLIPDQNNPLLIENPIKDVLGNVFSFRFSFPQSNSNEIGPAALSSSGLNYGQFFGVAFPTSTASELQFDQGSNPNYSCSLSDGTNNYLVTAVKPAISQVTTTLPAESHIAYCRLDEMTLVPLKVGLSISYTLTLTLTNTKFTSTSYIRTISLFTSTTNTPEKMIIDSIPLIGTAALYSNWSQWSNKALDILSAAIQVTQGPSVSTSNSVLYPYNLFDINLTLKSNTFISAADHSIVIKFPSKVVTAPSTVLATISTSTDPLLATLKGNLLLLLLIQTLFF